MNWVRFGDDNSTFFYQSLKQRLRHNRIMFIQFKGHNISDPLQIQQAFFDFYSELFYKEDKGRKSINLNTVYQGPILSSHHHTMLDLTFTPAEIK